LRRDFGRKFLEAIQMNAGLGWGARATWDTEDLMSPALQNWPTESCGNWKGARFQRERATTGLAFAIAAITLHAAIRRLYGEPVSEEDAGKILARETGIGIEQGIEIMREVVKREVVKREGREVTV
jgi:hypothetical protein